jgi:DNA polymerase III delta prime subunit
VERDSDGNIQQGEQVTSQESERLGTTENTDEQALSQRDSYPSQLVHSDLTIQTQGGAHIAGDMINKGGVNIAGGQVGTVNYYESTQNHVENIFQEQDSHVQLFGHLFKRYIVIFVVLILMIGTLLIGYDMSILLPSSLQPYRQWAGLLAGLLFVCGIAFILWLERRQKKLLIEPTKRNREIILRNVQNAWIKGVLEKSLHGIVRLELRLGDQLDALADPWRFVRQTPDKQEQELPIGTHITEIYDEANGKLLIIGGPGAGKTTLLLELTRDLLERAARNESYPIPVVFNLSGWAIRRGVLLAWLIGELENYGVSYELAENWLKKGKFLLLLDGLDEINPVYLHSGIEAINQYQRSHPSVSIVVCSRGKNYYQQAQRLLLNRAITIKPFTRVQIEAYLSNGGEQLTALSYALNADAELRRLAQMPLMLSVLTLVYQGMPLRDFVALDPLTTRQKQVFENYTRRMLERLQRNKKTTYTSEQMVHYVAWLARQLKQHHLTEFLELWKWDLVAFLDARSLQVYNRILTGLLGLVPGAFVCGYLFGWPGIILGGLVGTLMVKWSYKRAVKSAVNLLKAATRKIDFVPTPQVSACGFGCLYPLSLVLVAVLASIFHFLRIYWLVGPILETLILVLIGIGLGFVWWFALRTFIPRILLWRAGHIPWNYITFLNCAVDCIILLRVRGNYFFIHRLFLTYFAELEKED